MNNKIKVLLAERNRNVLNLLSRELEMMGCQVSTACDGQEALSIINTDDGLDVLVLDLDLAHISGQEILEIIKDRVPTLPVIVHAFADDIINGPSLERAAAIIEKRGDLRTLKQTIFDVANNRKANKILG